MFDFLSEIIGRYIDLSMVFGKSTKQISAYALSLILIITVLALLFYIF